MKRFLIFLLCAAALLSAYGKSLPRSMGPGPVRPSAPVSVRVSRSTPAVYAECFRPYLYFLRCTNRTAAPMPLLLKGSFRSYGHARYEMTRSVVVPAGSTREFSMLFPGVNYSASLSFEAEAPVGVNVDFSAHSFHHGWMRDPKTLVSPAFRPEIYEFLLSSETERANTLVRDWPTDTAAYAGIAAVILDSGDVLSPELERALRLAAARGTEIRVMVMGDAPWPAYAGMERKGQPFEERIGFGCWKVLRSQAVDSNPAWKRFIAKKRSLAPKRGTSSRFGPGSKAFRGVPWHEAFWYAGADAPFGRRILNNAMSPTGVKPGVPREELLDNLNVDIPLAPIPLGGLTLLMFCFVVVIGPCNYLFLKKRRQEMWCLVTIPILSLLFSGAVVLTVVFREGFDSKGKGRVLTVLDQKRGLVSSRGLFSIYSPLSMKEFRFDRQDLLYFREYGEILGEVTDDYRFSSRLLPSRMRFIGGIERAEFRSEKLKFSEKNGKLEVVNGLGVPVASLCVRSSGAKYFKLGAPLAPGARAELVPASPAKDGTLPEGMTGKPVRLEQYTYLAGVKKPLFIRPGLVPDRYDHRQLVLGQWVQE
ncbi:MAG: hypothetical protein IJT50_01305 [Lentisphaeria bacterium]|nr:hypothetical protein [Lentisphaeria bacterium]